MIATATFIAAETWAETNQDREPDPMRGFVTIMLLLCFAWFDLKMATIIYGGSI